MNIPESNSNNRIKGRIQHIHTHDVISEVAL